MAEFPHLIEITKIDDGRRVYIEGLGIEINDLTREELIELVHSTRYVCRKAKNALVRTVKECDSLWDIEGMPEEARQRHRKPHNAQKTRKTPAEHLKRARRPYRGHSAHAAPQGQPQSIPAGLF